MSTQVQVVIPDLFLPPGLAEEVCAGLRTPALGKILARAQSAHLPAASIEDWLCAAFAVENQGVAPVTLQADGGDPGTAYWLRADPVHLILRHGELILRPITADAGEAAALCDSLNRHFEDEGLHFIAPQPQHWYLRLNTAPALSTHPLAQVAGRDIHGYLPHGADALQWHRLLNEIQMLLFAHPVNQAREARGDWLINSVWLWGGGHAPEKLLRPWDSVYTDNALGAALAKVAGARPAPLPADGARCLAATEGKTLIIWDGLSQALQHGDLGAWRESLQQFERYAVPLLRAVRSGRIEKITLDVLQATGSRRFTLTRRTAWRLWRIPRRIEAINPG